MEINKVHNMDNREGLNLLPDKCANLIISDPPYFEVKGDFDFVWESFDEYLEFMEGQAKLYKRILADNGTLFVYGGTFNISYVQVIFDKYFSLVNSLVWNKKNAKGREYAEHMRMFAPCTERILMYSQDEYNLRECVSSIRDYIRKEIIKAKGSISLKEINTVLGTATNGGGVASACLSLDKKEPAMITKEMYEKLQDWLSPHLSREYEELRKEYEELRKEYEELRRPFENFMNYTEVLEFRNYNPDIDHDTVKPEQLTRALILTCSRKNDLVVVPFAGSGTECAMSLKEGRRFIGFELKEKFALMANKRCLQQMSKKELFG